MNLAVNIVNTALRGKMKPKSRLQFNLVQARRKVIVRETPL